MVIRKKHFRHVLSFAIVFAIAGFSFAVATQNEADSSAPVTTRAIGSMIPLAFANPFVNGGSDRDLGDAVVGSALTRVIRAKGGTPPYEFTTNAAPAALSLTTSGILSGILSTSLSPLGSANNRNVRFPITVEDTSSFAGSTGRVTETFRLNVVNTNSFRFALGTLSEGIQFQSYSERVSTINGVLPISYTASTVAVNGVPTKNAKLEDVGLSIASDGSVFGTPIVSGLVTFLASATDKNGAPARSRNGSTLGQTITLPLTANKFVSTGINATSITIKQGFGSFKDSVTYKGIANLDGKTPAVLSGSDFALQIGGYAAPTAKFDANGSAKSPPAINFKVAKTGLVSATIKSQTINLNLASPTPGTVDLAVQLRIGNLVMGSEILRFTVKVGSGGGVTLTYKALNSSGLGGAFQLTSVKGKDDKAATGDSWQVGFINRIPAGVAISGITKVDVAIGTTFDVTSSFVKNANGKITFKGSRTTPATIASFSADLVKGKGTYTTSLIPATVTGIPIAGKGGYGPYNSTISYQSATDTISGGTGGLNIFTKSSTTWGSAR